MKEEALERHLTFWADSFHEGMLAAQAIGRHWKLLRTDYEAGFIPRNYFDVDSKTTLVVTVLGGYRSWSPLPNAIDDLLTWGKPDLIVYDQEKGIILMAVEETAAVPTGNQALQRCERLYGASRKSIPFVYLLGEFGLHKDGGIRRGSIWPALQAIRLTLINASISTVIQYGDRESPDSYDVGSGFAALARLLWLVIRRSLGDNVSNEIEGEVESQYASMLAFVRSQSREISFFLPSIAAYDDPRGEVSRAIAARAIGGPPENLLDTFGTWPSTSELAKSVVKKQTPLKFNVSDTFLENISSLIIKKKGYCITEKSGSKPLDVVALSEAIAAQKRMFLSDSNAPKARFTLDLDSFPVTKNGARHVTTSNKIVVLCDSANDVAIALRNAFGTKLTLNTTLGKKSALVYICNSITPGRLFVDPYTGQIAAYVPIFARDSAGGRSRITFVYYPHQSHTQLAGKALNVRKKGILIIRELVDFAIFHGGVVVVPSTGEIVY